MIYVSLCLAPAVYLAVRAIKHRSHAEDWLLALLSAVLFAVLYLMINPADISKHFMFGSEVTGGLKSFLGVVAYSVIAGYLILRAMRFFTDNEASSIYKYLKILLAVVCVALVFSIFGTGLTSLIGSFDTLAAGNTSSGHDVLSDIMFSGNENFNQDLSLSYVFLVLQFLVNVLPNFLGLIIVFSGIGLITALAVDPYGEAVAALARKTGQICRRVIAVIMLSQICLNVLQLALGSLVLSRNYTLIIPLLSIVFMLVAMLLAGYFEKTRQLKADNDMFI